MPEPVWLFGLVMGVMVTILASPFIGWGINGLRERRRRTQDRDLDRYERNLKRRL